MWCRFHARRNQTGKRRCLQVPCAPPPPSSRPKQPARPPPTRVRCASVFLDKNRRYIGESQSQQPAKMTQRTPHPAARRRRARGPRARAAAAPCPRRASSSSSSSSPPSRCCRHCSTCPSRQSQAVPPHPPPQHAVQHQLIRGREVPGRQPARPFPSSIFRDKNRRDIGKSQSM
eukprot:COSAG01_NODE_506_length_16125_cov_5.130912_9_plen_174_part_00